MEKGREPGDDVDHRRPQTFGPQGGCGVDVVVVDGGRVRGGPEAGQAAVQAAGELNAVQKEEPH